MATVRLQAGSFDVAAEMSLLLHGRDDIGGIGCFVGIVRAGGAGRAIRAMTLEHYPGMTERALQRIAADAVARWDLLGCTVVHRYGRLLPADPIVLVLAAAAHRQAALEATAFLIDWLKTQAPFWKNEEFGDGETAWVDAQEKDDAAAARWGTGTP